MVQLFLVIVFLVWLALVIVLVLVEWLVLGVCLGGFEAVIKLVVLFLAFVWWDCRVSDE